MAIQDTITSMSTNLAEAYEQLGWTADFSGIELPKNLQNLQTYLWSLRFGYELVENTIGNYYKVTATGQTDGLVTAVIPSIYRGHPVALLKADAFRGASSLMTVYLPTAVKTIEPYAFFNCFNLTSIIYEGTKAEWESILKGVNWNGNIYTNLQVYCSNGVITLPMSLAHTITIGGIMGYDGDYLGELIFDVSATVQTTLGSATATKETSSIGEYWNATNVTSAMQRLIDSPDYTLHDFSVAGLVCTIQIWTINNYDRTKIAKHTLTSCILTGFKAGTVTFKITDGEWEGDYTFAQGAETLHSFEDVFIT